jgi:hypothetical protein
MRPLYRALAALTGLYLVVFGVVGLIVTGGDGLFATHADRVLGQGSNLFWSIVSLLLGAAVLVATWLGRNLDVDVNTYVGWGLLVIGSFALAVLRTDVNVLGFTVSTVVVTYVVGLALITAGFYGKVAPPEAAGAPRQDRQAQRA